MSRAAALRGRLRSPRARGLLSAVALVVIVAVVATVALVSQGFDVKQPTATSPFVWVLKGTGSSSTSGEYARVNTRLGELDTVRTVESPSAIVQRGDTTALLANDGQKVATVDVASPQDFGAKGEASRDFTTVADVKSTVIDGDYVGYLGSDGAVSVARLGDSGLGAPQSVDPNAGQTDAEPYTAQALAIGTDGVLYAYSTTTRSVLRWDVASGTARGQDTLGDAGPEDKGLELTVVGDQWVLYAPAATADASARIWTRTHPAATAVPLDASAVLQQPAAAADHAVVATSTGITELPLDGSAATATAVQGAAGTPAQPTVIDGVLRAAWLQNTSAGGSPTVSGVLWSADRPAAPVTLSQRVSNVAAALPRFAGNGSTTVLSDAASGLVWLVPSGRLVTASDDWDHRTDTTQNESTDAGAVHPSADQLPPNGEPDAFGVRPGSLVSLPVLLNDSDPNGDVITIAPSSLANIDAAVGSASITTDLERIAFQVSARAEPGTTMTFQYGLTDGISAQIPRVNVTLTVVGDETEKAPRWCADVDPTCVLDKPSLQVVAGGSGSVNVLEGWIDPEGDPVYVQSAQKATASDPGSVAVTENGRLFFQSSVKGGAASVPIRVTVADARGQTATTTVPVAVTETPALTVAAFSVVTHVGDATTVDPTPYTQNAAGPLTLSNWASASKDVTLGVGSSPSTFSVDSTTPGTYPVTFSVSDGTTSGVTARARVTVLSDEQAAPTVAPITIFIRPRIDSTVDVLSAVSDPAHRLLSVSEASPEASSADATLAADVVDHRMLRVTGSTSSGEPGVVGAVHYTVTGGGAPIAGTATVVMLDSAVAQTPIAVDDAVTARAGAQIDVPVLANDVSTDGGALQLDPSAGALTGQFDDGLAFASGDDVRLLAPTKPGRYSLQYSVFPTGAPTKSAVATIVVTVRAAGTDAAPKPTDLEARVVAGQSVSIPFSSYGVDPDGDRVSLTRIVTAPKHGRASVSASGASLEYTAVDDTFSGVDEFVYEVIDPSGQRGTATARVGVLADTTPSAPVTYTDYVQLTKGADSTAYIDPLSNDFDPLGGALSLVCVEPDVPGACGTEAPPGSSVSGSAASERTRLAALLTRTDGSSTVRISGDTTVGTEVYLYEARADSTRFTYGYIVVDVVDTPVPDAPRVTDTYVGVGERDTLASAGVDVVAGHASWQTGDADSLDLALDPSAPAGFSASGHIIRGPADQPTTVIVPFSLTGLPAGEKDAAKAVTTHGFLVVPGTDDIVIGTVDSATAPKVEEAASVTFRLADFLPPAIAARVQVDTASGHIVAALHAGATCAASSATADATMTYTAVVGAPYGDECVVPLRLEGQTEFSLVAIHIDIVPKDPVPLLAGRSAPAPTVNPLADPVSIDLMDYVSWQSGKAGDTSKIRFTETSSDGTDFTVKLSADTRTLSVAATDTAGEGRKGYVVVRFGDPYSSSRETLTIQLTVGPVPDLAPTGAHLSQECHTNGAAGSCTITAVNVGTGGERDYFDGGLTLVGKTVGANDCGSLSISLNSPSPGRITASWNAEQVGVTCTSRFAVKDASNAGNGHTSPASQYGAISWNIMAPPADPASIEQTNWGDKQVQFRLDLGAAASSYPALTHVWVKQVGASGNGTDCLAGQRLRAELACTISTSANDVAHTYQLSVENAEGVDRHPVTTSALSYAAPQVSGDNGQITLTPVYDAGRTSGSAGVVQVTIKPGALGEGVDRVGIWLDHSDGPADDYQNVSRSSPTTFTETLPGGRHTLIFEALNQTTTQPPGSGLDGRNDPTWSGSVLVATTPTIAAAGTGTIGSGGALSVSGVALDAQGSTATVRTVYYAWPAYGSTPRCDAGSDGYPLVPGGGGVLTSGILSVGGSGSGGTVATGNGTVNGLQSNTTYRWAACSGAGYGVAATDGRIVHSPIQAPANTTDYSVRNGSSTGDYTIYLNDEPRRQGDIVPVFNDNWRNGQVPAARDGQDPDIQYRWCYSDDTSTCSAWITVPAKDAHQAWQLHVSPSRSLVCTAGSALQLSANPYPNAAVSVTAATFYDGNGDPIDPPADNPPPTGTAPANAKYVRDVRGHLDFTASAVSGLAPFGWDVDAYDDEIPAGGLGGLLGGTTPVFDCN